MAVINRIAEYEPELRAWRRHLHTIPELDFDLFQTAAFVEERLREIGVDEIHTGIAKTGIVALIRGQGEGPVTGLRADMDALPIEEMTGLDYASKTPGRMHACGHDGHTTILLGAARYLAETRNFAGTVALIFQPSEELSGGGQVMVDEGIMERFGITRVFGLHNAPGVEFGRIATRPGPLMAAADEFHITVSGQGGHGAYPHQAIDPVPAALQIAQGLQAIPARRIDPFANAVISLTMLKGSDATNIIPQNVELAGTVRTLDEALRDRIEADIGLLAESAAVANRCTAALRYHRGYPVTVNDADQAAFAARVAADVVGEAMVTPDCQPEMGAEDFSYMLKARPGAYVFLGAGDGPFPHHPQYDFNDDISPIGASWMVRLIELGQPRAG
ncbi:MAG: amidohydrolase [Alphaproteobacteria bacterium]|nr:MAG: amidohydrolase [Alphaproteobacteria bacterium]